MNLFCHGSLRDHLTLKENDGSQYVDRILNRIENTFKWDLQRVKEHVLGIQDL